jgi:hypothetical protein
MHFMYDLMKKQNEGGNQEFSVFLRDTKKHKKKQVAASGDGEGN